MSRPRSSARSSPARSPARQAVPSTPGRSGAILADVAIKKPCQDVLLAIANLGAHLRKRSISITQAKLLERIRRTTGRAMSRATLNRHLRAWVKRRVLNRIKRHRRNRKTGALDLRATNYSFGLRGILWIKTIRDVGAFPLGRLAVSHLRQSQVVRYRSGVQRRGGQVVHRNGNRGPRRGRPTAPRARRPA